MCGGRNTGGLSAVRSYRSSDRCPYSFDLPGTQYTSAPPWPPPTAAPRAPGAGAPPQPGLRRDGPRICRRCSTRSSSNCSGSPTTRAIPACRPGHMETLRTLRLNRADLVPRYLIGAGSRARRHPRPARRRSSATSGAPAALVPQPEPGRRRVDGRGPVLRDDRAAPRIARQPAAAPARPALRRARRRAGVRRRTPAARPADAGPDPARGQPALQIGLEARLLLYRIFDRMRDGALHATGRDDERAARARRHPAQPGLRADPAAADRCSPNSRRAATAPRESGALRRRRTAAAAVAAMARAALGGGDESQHAAGDARPPVRRHGGRGSARRSGRGRVGRRDCVRTPRGRRSRRRRRRLRRRPAFALLQQLLSGRRELLGKLRPAPQPERARQKCAHERTARARSTRLQRAPRSRRPAARAACSTSSRPCWRSRASCTARARRSRAKTTTPSNCWACCTSQIEREVRARHARRRPARPPAGAAAARGAAGPRASSSASSIRRGNCSTRSPSPARRGSATRKSTRSSRTRCSSAVEHVVEHFDGDPAVFEAANRELQTHLQQLARKAEVTERRHVEAARGKEKLELAKRRASEAIDDAVQRPAPAQVRARAAQPGLGRRAHADAAAPRRGFGGMAAPGRGRRARSSRRHRQAPRAADPAAGRPDRSARSPRSATTPRKPAAIARRLTTGIGEERRRSASRTELAMKLKARARLGEDSRAPKPKLPPRNARRAGRLRTPAHPALRHLVRIRHQPAGRRRAPPPVVVQPGHRQRAVREPARPARRRAVAGQPGAHDGDAARRTWSPPTRAAWSTAPGRPRSARCAASPAARTGTGGQPHDRRIPPRRGAARSPTPSRSSTR